MRRRVRWDRPGPRGVRVKSGSRVSAGVGLWLFLVGSCLQNNSCPSLPTGEAPAEGPSGRRAGRPGTRRAPIPSPAARHRSDVACVFLSCGNLTRASSGDTFAMWKRTLRTTCALCGGGPSEGSNTTTTTAAHQPVAELGTRDATH